MHIWLSPTWRHNKWLVVAVVVLSITMAWRQKCSKALRCRHPARCNSVSGRSYDHWSWFLSELLHGNASWVGQKVRQSPWMHNVFNCTALHRAAQCCWKMINNSESERGREGELNKSCWTWEPTCAGRSSDKKGKPVCHSVRCQGHTVTHGYPPAMQPTLDGNHVFLHRMSTHGKYSSRRTHLVYWNMDFVFVVY